MSLRKYDCLVVGESFSYAEKVAKGLLYNDAIPVPIETIGREPLYSMAAHNTVIHIATTGNYLSATLADYRHIILVVTPRIAPGKVTDIIRIAGDKIITVVTGVEDWNHIYHNMLVIYQNCNIRTRNIKAVYSVTEAVMVDLRYLLGGYIRTLQDWMITMNNITLCFRTNAWHNDNKLDTILQLSGKTESDISKMHPVEKAELTAKIMTDYVEYHSFDPKVSPSCLVLGQDVYPMAARIHHYTRLSKTHRDHLITYLNCIPLNYIGKFLEYLHPMEALITAHKTGYKNYIPQDLFVFDSIKNEENTVIIQEFITFMTGCFSYPYPDAITGIAYVVYRVLRLPEVKFQCCATDRMISVIDVLNLAIESGNITPVTRNNIINSIILLLSRL